MRTLNITMSQAAKERLTLLNNLDGLPLPLDKEELRPFDFAFKNNVLCVTFEGRNIAFVPEHHNGKHFALGVATAPNEQVDMALRTFFARLTRHLDAVGRLLREEKRQEKRVRDEAQAVRDAEYAQKIAQDAQEVSDFWVKPEALRTGPVVRDVDFVMAARFSGEGDVFFPSPSHHMNSLSISKMGYARMGVVLAGGEIELCGFSNLYGRAAELHEKFTQEGFVLDEAHIREEILRMAQRNAEIVNGRKSQAFIEELPKGDMRIALFSMSDLKVTGGHTRTFGDIRVEVSSTGIEFIEQGCVVHRFSLSYVPEGNFPKDASQAIEQKRQHGTEHAFTPHDLEGVGNLMLSLLAEENPEVDFSACREMSVDELVAEVATTDIGYEM